MYPADRIPKVWTKPTAIVVNTDGCKLPGSHWIAMYVDRNGRGWFFDSYGLPPIVPQHLTRLRKNCKLFRYSTSQLQGPNSQCCGQYCVMFLHFMSCGLGIHRFRSTFSNDLSRNDKIAYDYYKAYIGNQNKSARPKAACDASNIAVGGGYKNNAFSHKRFQCIQSCCSRSRRYLQ